MAKTAFAYNIKTEGETFRVRGPVGETICTGPAQQAPVMLGWIRLAAWAHAQLRDDIDALNNVLMGRETNNLDPTDIRKMVKNHGKRRHLFKHAHRS
jgi:hypothetical protein